MWVKSKCLEFPYSTEEIFRSPNNVKSVQSHNSNRWMKFNMDGTSSRGSSYVGISGILRASDGTVEVRFSISTRVADSNKVELMAIIEAFYIFEKSLYNNYYKLWIESNSMNAAYWMNNSEEVPWRLREWIVSMETLQKNSSNEE